MSCCNSCGYSPCCCGGLTVNITPRVCCTPTTESVEYSAENQNLSGIGVFNGQEGTLFGFRGIVSDNVSLTVSLDAPNNVIVISFNDDLLVADIPTATETQRGIAEVATQAETNAGVVDNVIITPLKLNDRTATETRSGIAEIATQAEVTTGTDDTRIITPLKLTTFAGTQKTTRVFADAVARAAATPTFDGQLGSQLDNNALIMATGTTAGSFSPNIVIAGNLSVGADLTATGGTSSFAVITASDVSFDSGAFVVSPGVGIFTTTTISFETGTTFEINGTPPGGDAVLGMFSGAADVMLLGEFLSTQNAQTGYTTFTNSATIRTCNTATVTLQQLAQLVGTLIEDLKAVQLPAT